MHIAVDEQIPNDFFTITEGAMFIFQKIIRYIHSNLIGIHFSPSINRASLPTALHFLCLVFQSRATEVSKLLEFSFYSLSLQTSQSTQGH